ncbi:MAG: transposase, partial [Candidatus Binatia bacterium]
WLPAVSMKFDPETHHRRSARLRGYDYAQVGAYFVTVCTYRRECLFGQVEDGGMVLSQYGDLVERCWQILPRHFPGVELDAFVIMPNHVHGIISLMGYHTEGRGEAFAQQSQEQPCLTFANASPLRWAYTRACVPISSLAAKAESLPDALEDSRLGRR